MSENLKSLPPALLRASLGCRALKPKVPPTTYVAHWHCRSFPEVGVGAAYWRPLPTSTAHRRHRGLQSPLTLSHNSNGSCGKPKHQYSIHYPIQTLESVVGKNSVKLHRSIPKILKSAITSIIGLAHAGVSLWLIVNLLIEYPSQKCRYNNISKLRILEPQKKL